MKLCLNPNCQKPQNPDKREHCRNCGTKLLLKERYRAIAAIGQGGFGRTFLAIDEDKPSKPRCVIKQFLPVVQDAQHMKKAAALFEQEARRLEELGSHPQIPALLAHFSQDQQQYLVQEFIDGKNLSTLLAEQGAFDEVQLWAVLRNLLPVLGFIHDHRVIHRDVKPPNIILVTGSKLAIAPSPAALPDWAGLLQALAAETAQGFWDGFGGHPNGQQRLSQVLQVGFSQMPQDWAIADYNRCQQMAALFAGYADLTLAQRQYLVADASRLLYETRRKYEHRTGQSSQNQLVLVDFGAAKAATGTALLRTGTTIGSPEYLAPEQARGKAVFASDLYSLGVTCIHLLTNTSPFELFDTSRNAWIWRQALATPVSDRLGKVLDRLLEPAIGRRYASAAQVLADVEGQSTPAAVSLPVPAVQSAVPLEGAGRGGSIPRWQPVPLAAVPDGVPEKFAGRSTAVTLPPQRTPDHKATPRPQRPAPRAKAVPPSWQCSHRWVSAGKVAAIALSPTEPVLASASGTTIKLWDTQSGQPIRSLTGHLDIISSLVMNHDGTLLISGSADKSIRLWDLATGQRLGTLNLHNDTVLSLALSPKGQLLASSSRDATIRLWHLVQDREQGSFTGLDRRIDSLTFSPDGRLLASGSGDGAIALWDLATGKAERTLKGHTQAIAALTFSPDGKTLVSGSWDGTVKLWSISTRREKRCLELGAGRVNALTFSPDGKLLVTGNDYLQLWNPRTGTVLETLDQQSHGISAIAFDASSTTLVSSSWDGMLCVWRSA